MILHIDMDAFYASVEQLDNPDLKGKCVIVGGSSRRGVVSAASYEARNLGIHSAMPIYKAREKCPDGIFLRPRMERYKAISKKIMGCLKEFSPLVEQVSIDEAYLDITGTLKLLGTPVDIAMNIKKKIKTSVNLTCSVGIAPNKVLAKIASDMDKPDGLFIIMPEDTEKFIDALPINKVPGVGEKTKKRLEVLGIHTLGQVNQFPQETLINSLGKYGHRLIELAAAQDHTQVIPTSVRSSVSSETTLEKDTRDTQLIQRLLLLQSEDVGRQLRNMGKTGKTITIKIKFSDFKQITRSKTLNPPTNTTKTIYKEAQQLFLNYITTKKIRLVGVGVSGLSEKTTPVQMDLFDTIKERNAGWKKVDKVMDSINKKYGKHALERASLKKKS